MAYDLIQTIFSSILTIFTIQLISSILISPFLICIVFTRWFLKKWNDRYPEPAQQLIKIAKILLMVIFFELAGICTYFIVNFKEKLPQIETIFNSTYLLNLKNIVFLPTGNLSSGLNTTLSRANSSNISFENLTGIISIISIFIIFLYFYSVFGKTKYFAEGSEIQEKYAAIFAAPIYTVFCVGIVVILLDIIIYRSIDFASDFFLLIFGVFNLTIVTPIPVLLRKNFYNYGHDIETKEHLKCIYNYDFLQKFRELNKSSDLESNLAFISDLILVLTISILIFAYFFNSNFFMLIFAEYCLLFVHYWSSQLDLVLLRRYTIVLKECDHFRKHIEIKNVFILSDSTIEFVVLDEHNTVMEIMKNSVQQLIYQIN